MRLRLPAALLAAFLPALCPAQSPAQEGQGGSAVVAETAEVEEEEVEDAPVHVTLPTPEQLAALPAEVRTAQASAIKAVLLRQTLRMVVEEHRFTRGNWEESAALAKRLEAPAPLEEALLLLASGELSGYERRDVIDSLSELYRLYGVDSLAIRVMAESIGVSPELVLKEADWLPLPHVFNLGTGRPATQAQLQEAVEALCRVFTALQEQLATVQDTATADAAADALLALLPDMDLTIPLRLSPAAVQGEAFESKRDSLISLHKAITALRAALQEQDYYGSVRLRMVDYLLQ